MDFSNGQPQYADYFTDVKLDMYIGEEIMTSCVKQITCRNKRPVSHKARVGPIKACHPHLVYIDHVLHSLTRLLHECPQNLK